MIRICLPGAMGSMGVVVCCWSFIWFKNNVHVAWFEPWEVLLLANSSVVLSVFGSAHVFS